MTKFKELTTWASQQINQNNIVLPSNIVLNTFTHAAADNWNRATDSITGKHLDIVNLVMFQSNQKNMEVGSSVTTVPTLHELHFQKKESDR